MRGPASGWPEEDDDRPEWRLSASKRSYHGSLAKSGQNQRPETAWWLRGLDPRGRAPHGARWARRAASGFGHDDQRRPATPARARLFAIHHDAPAGADTHDFTPKHREIGAVRGRGSAAGAVAGDARRAGLRRGRGRDGQGEHHCYQRPVRPGGHANVVGGCMYEPQGRGLARPAMAPRRGLARRYPRRGRRGWTGRGR
jgi:hypothetical protein